MIANACECLFLQKNLKLSAKPVAVIAGALDFEGNARRSITPKRRPQSASAVLLLPLFLVIQTTSVVTDAPNKPNSIAKANLKKEQNVFFVPFSSFEGLSELSKGICTAIGNQRDQLEPVGSEKEEPVQEESATARNFGAMFFFGTVKRGKIYFCSLCLRENCEHETIEC